MGKCLLRERYQLELGHSYNVSGSDQVGEKGKSPRVPVTQRRSRTTHVSDAVTLGAAIGLSD